MKTDKYINNNTDENSRTYVSIRGELKKGLHQMRTTYGYEKLSLAAKNAAIVGLSIFQNSPDEFIKILNNNTTN